MSSFYFDLSHDTLVLDITVFMLILYRCIFFKHTLFFIGSFFVLCYLDKISVFNFIKTQLAFKNQHKIEVKSAI
jgi:hypothetical protein